MFMGSESEGYKGPTLNDIYENEVERDLFPCNQLESTECTEPTPSQLFMGVCFNRLSTEETKVAPSVGARKRDVRRRRSSTTKG